MTFTGVFAAVPTPFADDDQLDVRRLRAAIAWWVASPLTGFVILGSTAEAVLMDDDECDRVVDEARALVPRQRPFIVGAGRESTRATIRAAKRAADFGADAVLVRTPGFFKSQMTGDAFMLYYTAVAEASPVPVLLYNFTALTGVNLLPATVARLARHKNIVGMKESGSDISYINELVTRTPDDFTLLAGSATTYFHALCAGCDGGILALAALLPDACARMLALVRDDRLGEARALQHWIMPLARSIGGTYGVAGLKAALDLTGYGGGVPRPPLLPAPPHVVETISGQLKALDAFKELTSEI